jgi:hypothetical protein
MLSKVIEAYQYSVNKHKCGIVSGVTGIVSTVGLHEQKGPWIEWSSKLDDSKTAIIVGITSYIDVDESQIKLDEPRTLIIRRDGWSVLDGAKLVGDGKL